MRILFVTRYYPPSNWGGGYMQLCEEVASGLSARGHAVAVLTSTCGQEPEIVQPYPVYRLLSISPDWHSKKLGAWQFFAGRRRQERQDVAHLRQLVNAFRPDVVTFWDTYGLTRLLLQEAENQPGFKVAYYLAAYFPEQADEYMAFWQLPPVHWTARLVKRPLARLALHMLRQEGKPVPVKYEHVMCVSDYLRRRLVSQKLISPEAVVIHNGVDLEQFSPMEDATRRPLPNGLRCLVAGRVVPDKGIHTVIEALGLLQARGELDGVSLTVLGDGPADYLAFLRERISHHALQNVVQFRPPVPRVQMPEVLAGHDVLLLPSEYDEPLARSMQEAMAMSLLVIGTTTGGSAELLVHEETGLAFEPGNPESLVTQLVRAGRDRQLAATLAGNGCRAVVQNFNIQHTVEQVERHVRVLVTGR
jgi:glycogen(starch) synthase